MEEITANDVPMNGNYAIFPKSDMTELYAKAWDATGKIKTIIFKPEPDKNVKNDILNADFDKKSQKEDFKSVISPFFESLNARLDNLEHSLGDKAAPGKARAKKEAATDE